MCGINGFIKKIDNADNILNNMNGAIVHRGPDGQGVCILDLGEKKLGLGQVRLSIIDLSDSGFQPMYYDRRVGSFSKKHNSNFIGKYGDNAVKIVFNGEIYNYQGLKRELEGKGYKFSSKSDTEVILASYLEWGTDCVNRFNGMRAFAIYDPIKQEIFCSRDRLGKKPFYYYFDGNQFVFSSEIKGILEHKELEINTKNNIDSEAIDFYFTIGYIPAPWTIYKNVKKLESRHNLTIRILGNGNLTLSNKCYYEIPKYKPINDKKKLIREGKKLLEETVKDRMFTSEVPVGANLSGGLDSSSVVAEMTKWVYNENLHTFSIGFEGKYDESKYIHVVESAFGTNHHHKYFKEEDFETMLSDIYFYYDEPFGDFSEFPTRFVSELSNKYVKVVLTGDGGDEIFGGYMMHKIGAQMSIIYRFPKFLRKLIYCITPRISNSSSIFFRLKEAFRISLLRKEEFVGNLGGSIAYRPDIYKRWTKEKMEEILKADNGNFTQALIDFDLFYGTLSDNFLTKTDRASMSEHIEYRSPFCDFRWVDWGRNCPVRWKVTCRNNKIIMKKIIKGIVPKEILNRGKQGFTPPIKERLFEDRYLSRIEKELYSEIGRSIGTKRINSIYSTLKDKDNQRKFLFFLYICWYEKWIKNNDSN